MLVLHRPQTRTFVLPPTTHAPLAVLSVSRLVSSWRTGRSPPGLGPFLSRSSVKLNEEHFDMPKAWDITNTAVQLEPKSWAEAQRELLKARRAKQRLPPLRPLALPGLTARPQHGEPAFPAACGSQAFTALLRGTTLLGHRPLDLESNTWLRH